MAANYPIRHFEDNSALLYREELADPDMAALLSATDAPQSFFMGCHIRQSQRHPGGEAGPLLTVSDSHVAGAHRYMRLEIHGTLSDAEDHSVNFVAKQDGVASGSNDAIPYLDVAGTDTVDSPTIDLDTWYAVGVWVRQNTGDTTVTVYRQKHGGSLENSATHVTTDPLDYVTDDERLDLYSIARHAFVTTTDGPVVTAHQFYGDIAAPVWVMNPTLDEITDFMSQYDPDDIWATPLLKPDMDTKVDEVDSVTWTEGDSADQSVLTDTLFLDSPPGGTTSASTSNSTTRSSSVSTTRSSSVSTTRSTTRSSSISTTRSTSDSTTRSTSDSTTRSSSRSTSRSTSATSTRSTSATTPAAGFREMYIRTGATGDDSGSDWTNACPTFAIANSLYQRGDIWYIASGTYDENVILDTPIDTDNTVIEFRRATESDHGTNTGWVTAYGATQVIISRHHVETSYWTWDGVVGGFDETSEPGDLSSYLAEDQGIKFEFDAGELAPAQNSGGTLEVPGTTNIEYYRVAFMATSMDWFGGEAEVDVVQFSPPTSALSGAVTGSVSGTGGNARIFSAGHGLSVGNKVNFQETGGTDTSNGLDCAAPATTPTRNSVTEINSVDEFTVDLPHPAGGVSQGYWKATGGGGRCFDIFGVSGNRMQNLVFNRCHFGSNYGTFIRMYYCDGVTVDYCSFRNGKGTPAGFHASVMSLRRVDNLTVRWCVTSQPQGTGYIAIYNDSVVNGDGESYSARNLKVGGNILFNTAENYDGNQNVGTVAIGHVTTAESLPADGVEIQHNTHVYMKSNTNSKAKGGFGKFGTQQPTDGVGFTRNNLAVDMETVVQRSIDDDYNSFFGTIAVGGSNGGANDDTDSSVHVGDVFTDYFNTDAPIVSLQESFFQSGDMSSGEDLTGSFCDVDAWGRAYKRADTDGFVVRGAVAHPAAEAATTTVSTSASSSVSTTRSSSISTTRSTSASASTTRSSSVSTTRSSSASTTRSSSDSTTRSTSASTTKSTSASSTRSTSATSTRSTSASDSSSISTTASTSASSTASTSVSTTSPGGYTHSGYFPLIRG